MRRDHLLFAVAALGFATFGCNRQPAAPAGGAAAPAGPKVGVVKPEKRPVKRVVEQPGTVRAFEETALFARLTGYVGTLAEDPDKKDHPPHDRQIDRGSRVKKGQVLAELSVPELGEELKQKEALVRQAVAEVTQADKARAASDAAVAAAGEAVTEAEAGVVRAEALYARWQSEAGRIAGLVKGGLIDAQTRDETQNQFKASEAARTEATARVGSARAEVKRAEANRDKAAADVDAAKARLEVARANVGEVNARRGYLKITAPFDGVVTRRAVNPGDLVSATEKVPLFSVARTDPVRVVVQVPEADAGLVADGQSVQVTIPAVAGLSAAGTVSRTSWSLEAGSRTLWTEIDLPNGEGRFRPGMYVNARLTAELPAAWAVSGAAVGKSGDEAVIYLAEGGKAIRVPVQLGLGDGQFTQIRRYKKPGAADWSGVTGDESIATPAAVMSDGQPLP